MKQKIWATLISMGMAVSCIGAASAADWRAEFGIGAHGGDPEISFAGETDDLDTDTGIALTAQVWADKAVKEAPWLSLGVQYLRLQDSDFSESGSATVLGVAVTGQLDIEPTIDGFLANAAYRGDSGKWHPFIGGGVGFARADTDLAGSVTVNGQTFGGSANDDEVNFAWQLFAGADYDVTEKAYIGVNLRYFGTDATLFGADVEFRNFVGMANIGYRF